MMREDWVQVNIESVFKKLDNGKEINQGWSPQCKNHPSSSEDIWGVLKTTAIQKNEFWDHENKELPKDKEVRAHLEVKVGDIILTCAGPRNRCGVACTVIKTRPKLLLSGKMYRFRPDERAMTIEFLTFFLQTQESWLAIDKMKTGTSDSGLNLTHARFRKLPVRVAPLPEQRAIVTKIEDLFFDLDKGVADLKKAQDQLKIYRHAVLKKAFDGELTNTQMIPRTMDSLTSIITKGASPKWQGFDYTTDSNQLLFITSENVREGYISLEKEKYLPVGFNEAQKRSVLQKGDVLFNIVGASIGRSAIFELNKLSNINQAVALIRLEEGVLNQYVNYFLNSEGAKQEYLKKQVDVARANLSLQNVRDIVIPFCNVDEQRIVIQEIESRLSVCDNVEKSISESLDKAEALRQSILKKAFEGNLLSTQEIEKCKTEPDYEPAAVLLEKIKNL